MGPFDHLRTALGEPGDELSGTEVRPDKQRRERTGTPEVISAANKSIQQIVTALNGLLLTNGRVVISRTTESVLADLAATLPSNVSLDAAPGNLAAVAIRDHAEPLCLGGRVAVMSAGSSDIPVASEAALMAREMGSGVRTAWDVGVAGIHRIVRPLEALFEWDPDVFVVAAGMDGILPTIISGLVAQPVIGLPVSTGYGYGGEGVGALMTMLQTCSPGVSVVNIDNGIGAGVMAARIAIRAARNRSDSRS
jgi:NCAIR mutase (PurE)-related protein